MRNRTGVFTFAIGFVVPIHELDVVLRRIRRAPKFCEWIGDETAKQTPAFESQRSTLLMRRRREIVV
ncbi:hypothetical protein SESBI_22048 [Sesbania bispinosa]|nr:hypothetical protein SESBI_22048 [Sesbania bispinosa]